MLPVTGSFVAGFGVAFALIKSESKPLYAATTPSNVIPFNPTHEVSKLSKDDLSVNRSFRTGDIMRHGYPSLDNLRMFEDFVLSYDRRTRVASWVFEHMNSDKLRSAEDTDRGKSEFKEDELIHPYFRSRNQDYRGSGYDRGHMAAAANHRANQRVMDQTFYLSNMAPQVGVGFNRDKWNDLEREVRSLVKKNDNIWVCTGPLYLPRLEILF